MTMSRTVIRTVRAANRSEAARKAQRDLGCRRVRFLAQPSTRHYTYSVRIGG